MVTFNNLDKERRPCFSQLIVQLLCVRYIQVVLFYIRGATELLVAALQPVASRWSRKLGAAAHSNYRTCHVRIMSVDMIEPAMASKGKTRTYYSAHNFTNTVSFDMQASVNDSNHGRVVRIFAGAS